MSSMRHNKTIKSVLVRITLAACVYFVWTERNKRLFANEKTDNKELMEKVVNHVRLKLSSLKVRKIAQIVERDGILNEDI
ncbi:reverse transcriptase zinc-binding domain-containing protein [Artemisia annua]|uniref:Reverse transcriptase zinc-binding domain-containing protein n=1 Tax=Artemisia annua TaxID=35608 RepID=A0A2U1MBP1_ARTAN|nr:reverse transcriptase zinc-binding domain-containing protein [Artemisia annua]